MADHTALQRATESTDAPTPGYLYQDIAKLAAVSPVATAETVAFLSKRLTSKGNHNVKFKSLKVVQMVSVNPITRGQFKRAVCQDINFVTAIKECLNFRGPPDPVHGDEIYARVRAQAKETIDAIYSDTPVTEQVPSFNSMSSSSGPSSMSMNAYGGNPNVGGGYHSNSMGGGDSSGAKKMTGIGNPMFKDPRLEKERDIGSMTIGEYISAAKDGVLGIAAKIGVGSDHSNTHSTSGYRPSQGAWTGAAPPGARELTSSTQGQWTMASNRGPNAIGNNFTPSNSTGTAISSIATAGVGGSWGAMNSSTFQSTATYPVSSTISSGVVPSTSGGSYERNLIAELCPPGGINAEPPADKLQQFIVAIPSLNPDLICPALLDALEDGQPWIIRAKALCVMEVVINVAEKNKAHGQNNAYADFFHACKDEIEPLVLHSRSAIREPARRVLKAMGLEVPQEKTKPVAHAPPNTEIQTQPNLLDFGHESVSTSTTVPLVPPPTSAPPPIPATTGVASTPSTSSSSASGGDIFGGMNLKTKNSSNVMNSSTAGADFLGVLPNESVEMVLEKSSQPGLFGDVSIQIPTTEPVSVSDEKSTSSAPSNSSGFSFISGGTASTVTTDPASTDVKSSSSTLKDTFDPLLSLSMPSTSTPTIPPKPMVMNSQMMAVYQQQQQMMQMQMQMMQVGNGSNAVPLKSPMIINPNAGLSIPIRQTPVMSGNSIMGGSRGGVTTSFAFFDDPAKTMKEAREASEKKFDFVQEAMKGAGK